MLRYRNSPKDLKKNVSETHNKAVIEDENGEVIGFRGNVARLTHALKNQNSFSDNESKEVIRRNSMKEFNERRPSTARIDPKEKVVKEKPEYQRHYDTTKGLEKSMASGKLYYNVQDDVDRKSSVEKVDYSSYLSSSDEHEEISSKGTSDYSKRYRKYDSRQDSGIDFSSRKFIDVNESSSFSTFISPSNYPIRQNCERSPKTEYIESFNKSYNVERNNSNFNKKYNIKREDNRDLTTSRSRYRNKNVQKYDMKRSASLGRPNITKRDYEENKDSKGELEKKAYNFSDRYQPKTSYSHRQQFTASNEENQRPISLNKQNERQQKDYENKYLYKDRNFDRKDSYKRYSEISQNPSVKNLQTNEELNIYRNKKDRYDTKHSGLRNDQRTTLVDDQLYMSSKDEGFSKSNLHDCHKGYIKNDEKVSLDREISKIEPAENEEVITTESWEEVYTVPNVNETEQLRDFNLNEYVIPDREENRKTGERNLAEILSDYQRKGILPEDKTNSFVYPIIRRGMFIENTIDTTSAPRTIDIVSEERAIIENNDNPYQNTFRVSKENPLYTNNLDWQDTIGKNRFRKY